MTVRYDLKRKLAVNTKYLFETLETMFGLKMCKQER